MQPEQCTDPDVLPTSSSRQLNLLPQQPFSERRFVFSYIGQSHGFFNLIVHIFLVGVVVGHQRVLLQVRCKFNAMFVDHLCLLLQLIFLNICLSQDIRYNALTFLLASARKISAASRLSEQLFKLSYTAGSLI